MAGKKKTRKPRKPRRIGVANLPLPVVEDPFNLGMLVTVRRMSDDKSEMYLIQEAYREAGLEKAAKIRELLAQERAAGRPDVTPEQIRAEYPDVTEEITLRVMNSVSDEKSVELRACSLVADWSGDCFEDYELPGESFDAERVREIFLEGLDPEEVVPYFQEIDGGGYVTGDSPLVDQILKVKEEHEATVDELVEETKAAYPEIPQAAENASAEERIQRNKAASELLKEREKALKTINSEQLALYSAALEAIGVRESFGGGKSLRTALTQWILSEARKAEAANQRHLGRL